VGSQASFSISSDAQSGIKLAACSMLVAPAGAGFGPVEDRAVACRVGVATVQIIDVHGPREATLLPNRRGSRCRQRDCPCATFVKFYACTTASACRSEPELKAWPEDVAYEQEGLLKAYCSDRVFNLWNE
jgi:hypothetical protein